MCQADDYSRSYDQHNNEKNETSHDDSEFPEF